MTKSVNLRELILLILLEIEEKEAYSHLVIRNVLLKYQYLEKKERAFIKRVAEGTLENKMLLDYIINQYSSVKINKMKPVVRNLLRSAVYQLKYMDSVPASAICNESVKLAQKKGFQNLKGFVNGVLRTISRNIDVIVYPDEQLDELLYLSTMYSVPEWIIKTWLKEYDYMTVKTILEAFLQEHATSIRCNQSILSKDLLKSKLIEEGVFVEELEEVAGAFRISQYDTLHRLPSFLKGYFQVQDLSSMLVGEVADPKEGAVVLDVCASPGGKSLHIADKLNHTGYVEARDVSEYKVELIEENKERIGFSNVSVRIWDACVFDETWMEKADIVIADLPCSGLGVIGKKTDIKYKMTEKKQKDLVQLQKNMLSVIKHYVKPGGILIYSTCTIHRKENQDMLDWFLQEEKDFSLESMDSCLPEAFRGETTKKGYLQLLTGIHPCDGFFLAKLRRKQ